VIRKQLKIKWHHIVFLTILAVSAVLNLYALNRGGYGNTYYAAAVKSMLMSWHNFFFNSFDPNGFITIDKPPVGFWIQALSAWLFGFHGWALLLPQAIAGVISVALMYHLVKRHFGVVGGLIAAAIMAFTPIAVAVSRTNEIDSTLVCFMLLATWCLWKAIEEKKLRWLIWTAVIEGIAFNVKMMEAYLVLPALYFTYFVATHVHWRKKLLNLATMTVVLAAVSFSWPLAVDLTPANDRPWVGSTQTNNEMELIFGYNGLQRLTGRMSGHGGQPFAQVASHMRANVQTGGFQTHGQSGAFPGNGQHGGAAASGFGSGFSGRRGGFGGAGFGTGTPGVLRLFQRELSGQISWLLALALLSAIPLLRNLRWRKPLDAQERAAVFWLSWLLPMVVFFSIAGFFHPYYLVTMAPGIAGLSAAGLVQMWRDWKARNSWKWFLPGVFVLDLAIECIIVWPYANLRAVLVGSSVLAAALAAMLLWRSSESVRRTATGTVLGVGALLISPAYWSLTPILYGVNESIPSAGPQQDRFGGGGGRGFGFQSDSTVDKTLEAYLMKHYNRAPGSYLVATTNAMTAAPIILDTNLPVMAMGGFSGSDPAMTTAKLEQLTASGKVKYFLIPSYNLDRRTGGMSGPWPQWQAPGRQSQGAQANGPQASAGSHFGSGTAGSWNDGSGMTNRRMNGFGFTGRGFGGPGFGGAQAQVIQWIQTHCKLVPASEWQGSQSTKGGSGFNHGFTGMELYVYTGK
jgi:4-amino-4-deoxy-L-arabinose transferase-like glycosyltransferase